MQDTRNEEILSFLMIGQSNMAGRGELSEVKPIKNPDCLMLRMGKWQPMAEPVNPDRSIFSGRYRSGISLGASFADTAATSLSRKIGLIPCADGGTGIDEWLPGEILYDHALLVTRLAMRTSTLGGILWHQGENDCLSDKALVEHTEKFIRIVKALRRDLGIENIPFIIGELSQNYTNDTYKLEDRPKKMNEAYRTVAKALPYCGVVSSEGLSMKADGLHFDSLALREFGKRYFYTYEEVIAK